MSAIVIDTNVVLVAAGQADHMSPLCQLACLQRLDRARKTETIVLDRSGLIWKEYRRHMDPNAHGAGIGTAFLRHLLANFAVPDRVAWVEITPIADSFKEFPGGDGLDGDFDPSDKKFIAAARAHPERPAVVEASDSKWLDWEERLRRHGVRLEFPCKDELKAIHGRKGRGR